MKKTSIAVSIILIFSIVLNCVYIFAADVSAAARFDFIEIEYDGDIFDANEFSDDFIMVCATEHKNGYIDENGNTAIDFDFAYAGSFSNGLAPANVPYGKLGYIDKDGKFVIEPQFDSALEFSCALALVRKGNKTGFIDKTGKFVDIIKNDSYTPISSFSDGVCWVENEQEKRAVINFEGKLITDFDFVWSGSFSDGVCWASKDMGTDFNNIEMGLIDTDGNFIIEPGKYTYGGIFCDGVCWAKKTDSDKIFLIDKQGKQIASIRASLMPSSFSGGICVAIGGDLLSIMDTQGKTIYNTNKYLPVHYGGFNEGKMLVRRKSDGKYFIMRDLEYKDYEEQKPIVDYEYEEAVLPDNTFEIALKIDSPNALVNGIKRLIDPADERVCAFVKNGRTLLPMRFIAENLPGYTVTWDYISNSALVQSSYLSILLKPDMPSAEIIRYMPEMRFYEQHTITLDQPSVNNYDRLFLPVRALCDMVGANVFYDERGLVVLSNTKNTLSYDEASVILDALAY